MFYRKVGHSQTYSYNMNHAPPERYLKELITQTFPFPSDTKIARYNDEAIHTNKAQAFQAGNTHKF